MYWFSGDDEVVKTFEEYDDEIAKGVLADEIVKEKADVEISDKVQLRDWSAWIGIEKK
jgi:hypothetical protein